MTDDQVARFYRGKRVLVTGAGGFIGSHLAEALARLGARVRVLLRYNSSSSLGNLVKLPKELLGDLEIVHGNIEDLGCVRSACRDIDVVFHLAALISIPYSYAAPSQFVSTNIVGTINVLEAARELKLARVVQTSTSETYGTSESYGSAENHAMTENHPLRAQSPYAASKIAADKFAEAYQLSFETNVATIRPFNTYGPRQSPRAVIPAIICQLLGGKNEIRLGSLDPARDFNFVSDTVAGFLRVGASDAAAGKTLNICSGRAVTIGEVVGLVGKISGRDIKVKTDTDRVRPNRSEVMLLLGSYQQARELIGYEPRISLEEGLRSTYQYFQGEQAVAYGRHVT